MQVYAVGIFVEPAGARRCLEEGWWKQVQQQGGRGSAALHESLFAALLSDGTGGGAASFFPRCLHMVFARSVSSSQVLNALAERLKAVADPNAYAALCGALERGIGSAGLSKGDALTYLWAAPDLVRVLVRGEAAGEVRDPRLGRQLHGGFLGGEPSSPEAKDEVPKGAVALFRAAA